MTESRNYRFFQHRACEYFPCHKGVAEEEFNCLFCFCPLYALGRKCGGNCQYTDSGSKDCSKCIIPHRKDNYDMIVARYQDVVKLVQKADAEGGRT